jgi:hypothetical protein
MKILATALLLASSIAAHCLDLGSPTSHTPYDPYMAPVSRVLRSVNGGAEDDMDRVRTLMRTGRSFRYSYSSSNPYVADLPSRTAARRAGDCKAKSLWLIDQLGDANVRYVIGKARRSSKLSHAWVLWEHNNRWWILDCTMTREPIPADRVGRNEYIPFYSYAKNTAYRHATTSTMVATTQRGTSQKAVASRQAR